MLDRLFAAVDAYWHEVKLGEDIPFEISEETLRREAAWALQRLEELSTKG